MKKLFLLFLCLISVVAFLCLSFASERSDLYDLFKKFAKNPRWEDVKSILYIGESNGVIARYIEWENGLTTLIITNGGDFPIKFNYSADEYYYIVTNGKTYQITASDGNYPYFPDGMATLNPDEEIFINLGSSSVEEYNQFVGKMFKGEIAGLLAIINYGKTKIRLMPTEELRKVINKNIN